jgi:alkanesulfonate monooxygenase SsuD/methylene tetrahydromethanopterin reductase-like flavin-dependent oxidoreductase (luciferase family)
MMESGARADGLTVGVYVDAHLGIGPIATALERAGFSNLWVYDSPLVFAEPYMAMLEAARATSSLGIGPGVTQPGSRSAVATAQALGTLAVAAPGRVVLGIGVGNSARLALGQRPGSISEMKSYCEAVGTLLDGEVAEHVEGERAAAIKFVHPRGRWLDLGAPIETWVSAFGPRGQRLAGTYADGVFIRWEGAEATAAARERIAEGARHAGRDPGTIKLAVVYLLYPIESEAELETEDLRAALGPLVISRLRYLTAQHTDAAAVPAPFRSGFEEYRRYREGLDEASRHFENYEGYLVFTPEHLESFVTPSSIRAVCLVDSPARVVAELEAMAAAGVDHVSLQIAGPPARWIERMGREVLPSVSSGGAGRTDGPA